MKKNLVIVVAVSAFLALTLWITGLSDGFYRINRELLNKLFELIMSFFP